MNKLVEELGIRSPIQFLMSLEQYESIFECVYCQSEFYLGKRPWCFRDLENGDLELENGASQSVIAGNDDKKDPLKVMTNISFQSYQQETEQHKNHNVKIKKELLLLNFYVKSILVTAFLLLNPDYGDFKSELILLLYVNS